MMSRLMIQILALSVIASAAVAVFILLSGRFGELEAKLLASGLCVFGASVPIAACSIVRARRRARFVGGMGIALACVGGGVFITAIWAEHLVSDTLLRAALSAILAAYAAAHIAVMSLADLSLRYRWTLGLAVMSSTALTTMIVYLLWDGRVDGEWFWRIFGVLAIVAAASSVLVGIYHRLSVDSR